MEVQLIYYDFSMVKEFFEIDKRLSKKKITKRFHVAASERATWYADVSTTSPEGKNC